MANIARSALVLPTSPNKVHFAHVELNNRYMDLNSRIVNDRGKRTYRDLSR